MEAALAQIALTYETQALQLEYQRIVRLRSKVLGLARLSPEVVGLKTQWWSEQLNSSDPRHPELLALSTAADQHLFGEYLIECEARIANEHAATPDESKLRLLRIFAPAWQALAATARPETQSDVSRIALALGLVSCARQSCWPGVLCPTWTDDNGQASCTKLADEALVQLNALENRVTGLRSLDILATLLRAECERIGNDRPHAALRQVWLAWRTARQLDYTS